MKFVHVILLLLVTSPLFAQDANSEAFRDLLKSVPQLPMERIEIGVSSSVGLVGISAVSVDRLGNIYVLHHPKTGEMIGRIDVFGHELAFSPDGMLFPATRRSELLLFRPRE